MKKLDVGEYQGQGCSLGGNYKGPEERWQEHDLPQRIEVNMPLWGSRKFWVAKENSCSI